MSDVDDDNSNIPKNTIELMYVHEPICFYYWNNMLSNVQQRLYHIYLHW